MSSYFLEYDRLLSERSPLLKITSNEHNLGCKKIHKFDAIERLRILKTILLLFQFPGTFCKPYVIETTHLLRISIFSQTPLF